MKGFEDKNKKLSVPWDLEFAKFKEIAVGLAYNDKYDQEWDNYNRWQQEDIQNKGLKCITYQSEVARHKLTFTLFFVNNKLVKAEGSLKEQHLLNAFFDIYNEITSREGKPTTMKNFNANNASEILSQTEENFNPSLAWHGKDTTIQMEIEQKFAPTFRLLFFKSGDETKLNEYPRLFNALERNHNGL
ncbi:MAG TPA: hypothetical protein VFF28_05890 [Candidatus Nanoarchaeia archaeon]|nr:hypothetical protein [Candidatus Nanoarchaeia archaeon]